MKLVKPFRGVPDGEIYPVEYAKGDECPKELEDAARAAGCLKAKGKKGESDLPDDTDELNDHTETDKQSETDDGGEETDEPSETPDHQGEAA